MKRAIGSGFLLGVLVVSATIAVAQNITEQTIASPSGRYSFTVPGDWYVSNEPIVPDIQGIFPSEAITIADSETTLEQVVASDFDPFRGSSIKGAVIIATVWGAGLLEAAQLDLDDLTQQLAGTGGSDAAIEPVERANLTGQQVKLSRFDFTLWFLILTDKSNNLVWVIALSDDRHTAQIEAALASLHYQTFPEKTLLETENMTNTVNFLDDTLAVDIPAGWWAMIGDGNVLAMPSVDFDFMNTFNSKPLNLQNTRGIVVVALSRDKSTLPPEAYDAEGNLNPEVIVRFLNLAEVTGQVEELENIEVLAWRSNYEVEGVSLLLDRTTGENLIGYFVALNGEDSLPILASMATPEVWEVYRPTIEAIFQTARFIEN